jgi:phasin
MASAPKKPALAPAPAAVKALEAPVAGTPVPLAPLKPAAPSAIMQPASQPASMVEHVAETMQAAMIEPAKVIEQVAETMQTAMREPVKAVEAMAEPMREIQDQLREVAEKSLGDTRVAFERIRAAAEETSSALETSMKNAVDGVQSFNLKVVEAMRVNAEASFDLMKALVTARSLSEAIALNSEHVRKSFDAISAQSKELSESAQKIAVDAVSPLREGVAKAFTRAA